jgi:hypothetical protein
MENRWVGGSLKVEWGVGIWPFFLQSREAPRRREKFFPTIVAFFTQSEFIILNMAFIGGLVWHADPLQLA